MQKKRTPAINIVLISSISIITLSAINPYKSVMKIPKIEAAPSISNGKPLTPSPTAIPPQQGNQGLQGGWAIDNNGNISFPHSLKTQLPLIQEAKAKWIRINFRLGSCFTDWTTVGCNGSTALIQYDSLVNDAQNRGLKILGLLSNESWSGSQTDWTTNNAENTSGTGDNSFLQAFSQQAAVTLAQHFQGKIDTWEVWNEPNAWTSNPSPGVYTGSTFMYPSNFAWLLRHVYEDTRVAGLTNLTFVSGGLFCHDIGGTPVTASCANYLASTYQQGVQKAGWGSVKQTLGSYPLDAIGQHIYVDQTAQTSSSKIKTYLDGLRSAYVASEGATTSKKTIVTEVGWTTASVNQNIQSNNLKTAYSTFRGTSYLTNAYWFSTQDIPEADQYYGLQTGGDAQNSYTGVHKKSFGAYQQNANF